MSYNNNKTNIYINFVSWLNAKFQIANFNPDLLSYELKTSSCLSLFDRKHVPTSMAAFEDNLEFNLLYAPADALTPYIDPTPCTPQSKTLVKYLKSCMINE